MKKRLLLDRVALHAGDIAPRHLQHAVLVVAHFTDADRAGRNATIVAAGMTTDPLTIEPIVHVALTRAGTQDVG
jgi:hypothetical protein